MQINLPTVAPGEAQAYQEMLVIEDAEHAAELTRGEAA